jgi:hypothetical protein
MTRPDTAPLQPGTPISGENVSLLRKGDLLRANSDEPYAAGGWSSGDVLTFERMLGGYYIEFVGRSGDADAGHGERFTFIGRPEADGWITWAGGENPVPGKRVYARFRDGYEPSHTTPSEEWDWSHNSTDRQIAKGADDIIAYRLASLPEPATAGEGGEQSVDWSVVGPEAIEAVREALSHCGEGGYLNCGKPATDKMRAALARAGASR